MNELSPPSSHAWDSDRTASAMALWSSEKPGMREPPPLEALGFVAAGEDAAE